MEAIVSIALSSNLTLVFSASFDHILLPSPSYFGLCSITYAIPKNIELGYFSLAYTSLAANCQTDLGRQFLQMHSYDSLCQSFNLELQQMAGEYETTPCFKRVMFGFPISSRGQSCIPCLLERSCGYLLVLDRPRKGLGGSVNKWVVFI